jgi:hypothetical protein
MVDPQTRITRAAGGVEICTHLTQLVSVFPKYPADL